MIIDFIQLAVSLPNKLTNKRTHFKHHFIQKTTPSLGIPRETAENSSQYSINALLKEQMHRIHWYLHWQQYQHQYQYQFIQNQLTDYYTTLLKHITSFFCTYKMLFSYEITKN